MSGKYTTVIGVDEAGYGPRLGPLVVALSAFRIPVGTGTLRELLPVTARRAGPLPVDDSKKVYRGGDGLGALEASVLAFRDLAREQSVPDTRTEVPAWELEMPREEPVRATPKRLEAARAALLTAVDGAGVTILEVSTRTVGVREFNHGCEKWGTKARVLFDAAAELIRPWMDQSGRVDIHVDRHGGRAYYSELLAAAFPTRHHWVVEEGRRRSAYRFPAEDGEVVLDFEVEADSRHLSTALASMCAKYVRELNMLRFNEHFGAADPSLRPTAGYAQDARRWLAESRSARDRLGVADADLLRVR